MPRYEPANAGLDARSMARRRPSTSRARSAGSVNIRKSTSGLIGGVAGAQADGATRKRIVHADDHGADRRDAEGCT